MKIPLRIEPDPSDPEGSWIMVDGSLDGTPVEFLVDTGAGATEVAVGVGGDATRAARPTSGVWGQSPSEVVLVGVLEIGPLRWTDIEVGRRTTEMVLPSLLGMDLLRSSCCTFRFGRRELDVEGVEARHWFPLVPYDLGLPMMMFEIGGRGVPAVWDTGASFTVVDVGLVAEHPGSFVAVGASVGTDASGTSLDCAMYELHDAWIAGRGFAPHRVAAVDLSTIPGSPRPLAAIGCTTIRQADWTLDFPRSRWAFDTRSG